MDIYGVTQLLRDQVQDEGKIKYCDVSTSGADYIIVSLLDMRDVALLPTDCAPSITLPTRKEGVPLVFRQKKLTERGIAKELFTERYLPRCRELTKQAKDIPAVYAEFQAIFGACSQKLDEMEDHPIDFMIDLLHQIYLVNWHYHASGATDENFVFTIYQNIRRELLYFFDIVSTTR